jgi:aspartyl-tRNA(Asn)/glutamyl-tRNA(Gln) amidotransferase subunit C
VAKIKPHLHIVTNKFEFILWHSTLPILSALRIWPASKLTSKKQRPPSKLSGILGLIEQMQAVDTTGITPMSHSQDVTQRLREDVVTEANNRAAFQAIAPQVQDGLYLVPKVIE